MKKFLALLLALVMVLSLSTVALAAEEGTAAQTVTIKKSYKLVGTGSSPAETFTLTQVGEGVVTESEATSAPHLGTITGAAFTAGEATATGVTHNITVELPSYSKVGVYTYTLRETDNKTAGVAYHAGDIKLVVTVQNGTDGQLVVASVHTESPIDVSNKEGKKSDTFENTYSANTLSISKNVEGNLGDKDKYFEFKVTLTGDPDKTYADPFAVTGGSKEGNPTSTKLGEETTFSLKHGETINIANLPYGVQYTVAETADTNYTTKVNGEDGTSVTGTIGETGNSAAFVNTRNGDVDTGVMLDSLPYIMVLAFVAIAGVALISKKRYNA